MSKSHRTAMLSPHAGASKRNPVFRSQLASSALSTHNVRDSEWYIPLNFISIRANYLESRHNCGIIVMMFRRGTRFVYPLAVMLENHVST